MGMRENMEDCCFLSQTALFQGISLEEIQKMLNCLGAEKKKFGKTDIIYHAGDKIQSMGMVLSGRVHIENDDLWGNKSMLDNIEPGAVFAETYACVPEEPLMVNVVAAEASEILFLNVRQLIQTCSNVCTYHSQLIQNLLMISAQKNLNLSRRIFHTSSKSIRGRLLSYLSFQARHQGKSEFIIPFNRQQLADYLSVDRSALSNELSKMQKDGLLKVNKNCFSLEGDLVRNYLGD